MYLSRLRLDPRLSDPVVDAALQLGVYRLHQAVYAAFDPELRTTGGILYRREPELHGGCVTILVQSRLEPDWDRGFATNLCSSIPAEVKERRLELRPGQLRRFRLRANPTRKVHMRPDGTPHEKGRRVSVLTQHPEFERIAAELEAEYGVPQSKSRVYERILEGWIRSRLSDGAEIIELQVANEGLLKECYTKGEEKRLVAFQSIRFDGALVVRDADHLRALADLGVGSAKGFGFGLLSLTAAA